MVYVCLRAAGALCLGEREVEVGMWLPDIVPVIHSSYLYPYLITVIMLKLLTTLVAPC